MVDKRTIETVLLDQKEELDAKWGLRLCSRMEESLIDFLCIHRELLENYDK